MNTLNFSVPPTLKLEDAIKGMLSAAECAYIESPSTQEFIRPSFKLLNLYHKEELMDDSDDDVDQPITLKQFKVQEEANELETKKACKSINELEEESEDEVSEGNKSESFEESLKMEPEPFTTPYHCQSDFENSCYDLHVFQKKTCIITPDGEVLLHSSDIKEVLVVHKDWLEDCEKMQGPVGGCLGKGLQKWAFKRYVGHTELALFQLRGVLHHQGVSNTFNHTILEEDFMSLMKVAYHLNVFKQRAAHYGVELLKIRYNAEGSFFSEVVVKNIKC
ncbi:hypothetical protein M422DRAFT_264156 [Sphaerobolus stellatus SS14]|uniref:Uncharacterized protein n=1 Tax=Sphaerobolus stellatus (strain SS14) TaxID=990650 RepID=A0A0C9UGH5_SPHS4|nr:hypothetical protein M422DRAFT_264156 [Sphaerobolus stellatus SS14]